MRWPPDAPAPTVRSGAVGIQTPALPLLITRRRKLQPAIGCVCCALRIWNGAKGALTVARVLIELAAVPLEVGPVSVLFVQRSPHPDEPKAARAWPPAGKGWRKVCGGLRARDSRGQGLADHLPAVAAGAAGQGPPSRFFT